MELFKRKPKLNNPIWVSGDDRPEFIPASVNYDSALEWLVGLSDEDFDKMVKVATVYRISDNQAAEILGRKPEPTTFIVEPTPPIIASGKIGDGTILDDEDDILFDQILRDDDPEFIPTPNKRAVDPIKKKAKASK